MSISNLRRRFALDLTKAETGVTADLGDGITVTIARFLNPKHEAALERAREPYKALLEAGGKIPDAEWKRAQSRALAEGVLVGWAGVTDEDGAAIPYSVDAAADLLADEEMISFRQIVTAKSQEQSLFLKYSAGAAEKNSVTSPAGMESGASS